MYTFIVNSANPEKSKKDDMELESLAKYSICHEKRQYYLTMVTGERYGIHLEVIKCTCYQSIRHRI